MSEPQETAESLEDFKTRIIQAALEFDASDDYYDFVLHDPDEAYAAAIDRVVHLIKGDINDWTDPRPLSDDI